MASDTAPGQDVIFALPAPEFTERCTVGMMKYVPFLALVLFVLILGGVLRSEATASAQVAASMVNGNLTVRSSDLLVKIKHKKKHNKNNDDNDDQSSSDEHSCPVGSIVLDKPDKDGKFCEKAPKPAQVETSKCGGNTYCKPGTSGNACCAPKQIAGCGPPAPDGSYCCACI